MPFLKKRPELAIETGSDTYERLGVWLRRAKAETLHRSIARLGMRLTCEPDKAFKAFTAYSQPPNPPKNRTMLKQLHPSQQRSPLMLVIRICRAAEDSYSLATALLEQLCVSGRVVLSEANPLAPVIRRLADHNLDTPVLENRPRTSVYRLARPWHHAQRILARDGQLEMLTMPPIRRATLSRDERR